MARITAVPAVMIMMQWDPVALAWPAAILFGVAAGTDFVDGMLARRWNQVSDLGKLLDPLADKLLVLGPLMCLLPLGRVSPWLAFLVLGRELVVSTLRTVAMGRGVVMAARRLGKQKTLFQMFGLGFLIVGRPVGPMDWSIRPDLGAVGGVLLWVGAVLAVISAVDYFSALFRTGGDGGPTAPSSVDNASGMSTVSAPSRE